MTTSSDFQTAYATIQDINNYRKVVNSTFVKGDFNRAREIYRETESLLRDVGAFCRKFNLRPSVYYSNAFINYLMS